jgi:hypothetical protein
MIESNSSDEPLTKVQKETRAFPIAGETYISIVPDLLT